MMNGWINSFGASSKENSLEWEESAGANEFKRTFYSEFCLN